MSFHSLGRSGLGRALLLSLAFHFLLLWPSPTTWQDTGPTPSLVATLRSGQEVRPVSPPLPRLSSSSDAVKPTLVPADHEAAATEPAPARVTAVPAGAAESSTVQAVTAAVAAPESQAGVDAEGLREYRLALARQARSFKRYPKRAEEAGWAGTAEVRISILENGQALEPKLQRSSGHALLDEAAIEMIRQALPATPVPPALRQQAFSIDLPVVFELAD